MVVVVGEEKRGTRGMVVPVEMKLVLFVIRVVSWGVIVVELRMKGAVLEMRVVLFRDRVIF